MENLLEWVESDETKTQLPIENFMRIKKTNQISTQYCPVCDKQVDGFNCMQNKDCPFEAPLRI